MILVTEKVTEAVTIEKGEEVIATEIVATEIGAIGREKEAGLVTEMAKDLMGLRLKRRRVLAPPEKAGGVEKAPVTQLCDQGLAP